MAKSIIVFYKSIVGLLVVIVLSIAFGFTQSAVCGNGLVEAGEGCDDAISQNSCESLGVGYISGNFSCEGCKIDTSQCVRSICGNAIVEDVEQCDELATSKSCIELGFGGGTIMCNSDCTFDTSTCSDEKTCGNGLVDEGEVCDDGDDNGIVCDASSEKCAYCSSLCTIVVVGGDTEKSGSKGGSTRSTISEEEFERRNEKQSEPQEQPVEETPVLEKKQKKSSSGRVFLISEDKEEDETHAGVEDADHEKSTDEQELGESGEGSSTTEDRSDRVIPDELLETGPRNDNHEDSGEKTLLELACDEDTYILYRYGRLVKTDAIIVSQVPMKYQFAFTMKVKPIIDLFIKKLQGLSSTEDKNTRIRSIVCKIETFKDSHGLRHQHIGLNSGLGYVNYILQYIQDLVILAFVSE